MTPLSKNRIRTITLWIGILTALLLIFGSLSITGQSALGENIFDWLYQAEPWTELATFSSTLFDSLSF